MKKCVGVDCEYFDDKSYVDAWSGCSIPYCKQKHSQISVDYENRILYTDDCEPSISVINICGKRYGSVSGLEY